MSASRALLLGAAIGVGLACGAAAGELGFPGSALEEFAKKERAPSFDAAPPLEPPIATGSIAAPSAIVAPAPSPAPAEPATPTEEPASPAPSPPPTKPAARPAPRPPAQETPATTGLDEYEARCFVKIDGKVLVARGCRILREGGKSVVFEIEDGPLTIDLRQGRVWTARLKERDFGNVYKTGECWGAHGFYACDRGRK